MKKKDDPSLKNDTIRRSDPSLKGYTSDDDIDLTTEKPLKKNIREKFNVSKNTKVLME